MKPTLLVLAAGMGSRYGGLKQLDQVGPSGETIIDYSVYDAIRGGFGKIVFIIRKDIEAAFKEAIGSRYAGKINIEYAYQELSMLPEGFTLPPQRQKPWGTGHAVLCAAAQIHEPFAVINADDFYGAAGYRLIAEYLSNITDNGTKANYCMCGFMLRNTLSANGTVSRGICTIRDATLVSVKEMTKLEADGDGVCNRENGAECTLTGNEIASMNMWGFTPSLFKHLERLFSSFLRAKGQEEKSEFYIPSVADALIQGGCAQVRVIESSDAWFGITYREDKDNVVKNIQALVERGIYPKKLF
jgi:dTDP-glucose pyrophosphorylase